MAEEIIGVSILRAGESMEQQLREVLKGVKIGKILIQRDESSADKKPKLFYARMPPGIAQSRVLLLDPMLARCVILRNSWRGVSVCIFTCMFTYVLCCCCCCCCWWWWWWCCSVAIVAYFCFVSFLVFDSGGSAICAIRYLIDECQVPEEKIFFVNLIACPEGLAALYKAHPKIKIITSMIDYGLNEHKYILPGIFAKRQHVDGAVVIDVGGVDVSAFDVGDVDVSVVAVVVGDGDGDHDINMS